MLQRFEFPYNFDYKIIDILKILDDTGKSISCIYIPAYFKDYKTVIRNNKQKNQLKNMSEKEYFNHIQYIQNNFPGMVQILLQRPDIILDENVIKKYLSYGINKFNVGNIKQAKIIKNISNSIEVLGSITMKINEEKINNHYDDFKKYFNGFILPFEFCKDLTRLKNLPKEFNYILLVNGYCNFHCDGTHHWFAENVDCVKCPGILGKEKLDWKDTIRIRPMDIPMLSKYVNGFKLQDRGWTTDEIIRDYVLYTTNYSFYPLIEYKEEIYER